MRTLFRNLVPKIFTLKLLFLLNFNCVVYAQEGSIDSTFGINGIVVQEKGAGWDLAIYNNQRIVLGGKGFNFTVVSYKLDGTPDSSFGNFGKIDVDLFENDEQPYTISIQPDGKILLAGYIKIDRIDFALVRFNLDGSLDSGFDYDGIVTTDFNGGVDAIRRIAIQSDGKIIAAGIAETTLPWNFAMARYLPNGSLDFNFGNGGKVITEFNNYSDAWDILIYPDSKILCSGWVYNASTNWSDFALVRYLPDGSLDNSFGVGGKIITQAVGNPYYNCEARSVLLQHDNKIVVGGYVEADFAMIRYLNSGEIDTTFGNNGNGIVLTDFNGGADEGNVLLQDSVGHLLLAGQTEDPVENKNNFALARYTANGLPDSAFGLNGKVTINIFSDGDYTSNDFCYGMAIQPNGKIVLGGRAFINGEYYFAAVRINANFSSPVSVETQPVNFPKLFNLYQNYPNPFNPSTIIKYSIPTEGFITLKIFDMLGREVETLINQNQKSGSYEIEWNANNQSSGIYFYQLKTSANIKTQKMLLLK